MPDFGQHFYQPVSAAWRGVQIGALALGAGDALENVPVAEVVRGRDLRAALADYLRASGSGYQPPLAALVYFITGDPAALDACFPLLNALGASERDDFHALTGAIAAHPNFDLRLRGERGQNLTATMARDARWIVAGQVAEVFFRRRDLLARLFATPRPFWLYASPRAFAEGGGVAGGCYNADTGAVQLLLARIYEGFRAPAPGVSPLLHEFCHMLDHFDVARGERGRSSGLLPGLRPADGAPYTPAARAAFAEGKRLELARYERRCAGATGPEELPIGHPYVFQNDTEFIAGYLELFFRCPNGFAAMNPALFSGFAALFGYDPRAGWAADFPFYLDENRRYYTSGAQPPRAGITVPSAV